MAKSNILGARKSMLLLSASVMRATKCGSYMQNEQVLRMTRANVADDVRYFWPRLYMGKVFKYRASHAIALHFGVLFNDRQNPISIRFILRSYIFDLESFGEWPASTPLE
jgi:hypothetical protein